MSDTPTPTVEQEARADRRVEKLQLIAKAIYVALVAMSTAILLVSHLIYHTW